MKVLRVLLVVLLCLVLAAVMISAVGDHTVRTTVLDADFTKDRLTDEVYGDSGDESVYQVVGRVVEGYAVDAFEDQAEEGDWDAEVFVDTLERVLEDVNIDEWLQAQVEGLLEKVDEDTGEKDGIFPYLNKEVDDLEMVITLREFRDRLVTVLPETMQEEFDTLLAEGDLPEGLAELAQAQARAEFDQAVQAVVDEVDEYVPEQVDISPSEEDLESIDAVRDVAVVIDRAFIWHVFVAVFLMLLIALIIILPFKKIRGRAKNILLALGIVFLATGIICVIVAVIGANLLPKAVPIEELQDSFEESFQDMGEDVSAEALTDAIDDVINEDTVAAYYQHLFAPARAAGIILLIIGLAMLVAWLVWRLVGRGGGEEEPPEELPVAVAATAGEGAPAGLTEEPFGEWTEADEKLVESTDGMAQAEVSSGEESAGLTEEIPEGAAEESAEEPSAEPSEDSDEDSLSELMDESPEESS
jgi:hypothetical protein